METNLVRFHLTRQLNENQCFSAVHPSDNFSEKPSHKHHSFMCLSASLALFPAILVGISNTESQYASLCPTLVQIVQLDQILLLHQQIPAIPGLIGSIIPMY